MGADATECAFFDFIDQCTTHVFKGCPHLVRIAPGGFRGNEIFQNIGGHFKHGPVRLYLSVQLIHGSIDRTMTGTSDKY